MFYNNPQYVYNQNTKNSKFLPVDEILGFDDSRLWYHLTEYYNGYEISNDGIVRSMKHYRKYPYGIIVHPKGAQMDYSKYKSLYEFLVDPTQDYTYELSNRYNERVTVKRSELIKLANENPFKNSMGYPRRTYVSDISSRNQRVSVRKQTSKQPKNNEIRYSLLDIQNGINKAEVPIESINNGKHN